MKVRLSPVQQNVTVEQSELQINIRILFLIPSHNAGDILYADRLFRRAGLSGEADRLASQLNLDRRSFAAQVEVPVLEKHYPSQINWTTFVKA